MSNIGIDISSHQPSFPAGDWAFAITKATEGIGWTDPAIDGYGMLCRKYPAGGYYHYMRPRIGRTGAQEADFFCDTILAKGFRKGRDIWQLDAESMGNTTVPASIWRTSVPGFMKQATARLGDTGFLYLGWFFFRQLWGGDLSPLRSYRWWLPAYGPNDGSIPSLARLLPGAPLDLAVIHQFSSAGNLDRNIIRIPKRFPSGVVIPHPLPPVESEEDNMIVVDYKNPVDAQGQRRMVQVIPQPESGQFVLIPRNSAAIAGPGVTDPHAWHVQKANGKFIGLDREGQVFTIGYDDDGTFSYSLVP